MSTTHPVSIQAGGRTLVMTGTVQSYLDGHAGWQADSSAVCTCLAQVPRGATVLDAGANIGMVACTMAAHRPDLHVIAIEPVPDNVACLRENIAVNGLANVEVVHAAVSDRPGTLRVNINGPWSRVMADGAAEVPAIPLDQFLDRAPAFVKIDVEGWEPYVLAGAAQTMTLHRPLVFMEFNACRLLLERHDPVALAHALWAACDIHDLYHLDQPMGAPERDRQILTDTILRFSGISDILMRPKGNRPWPSLAQMIYTADHLALLDRAAPGLTRPPRGGWVSRARAARMLKIPRP